MQALVVDPGKVTGYGFLSFHQSDKSVAPEFRGSELHADDFVDLVETWLADRESADSFGIDLVVCENFTVTERTVHQREPVQWSTEQIGVLRHRCRRAGVPFVLQPTSAKAFGSDEKLKKLGWYGAPRGSGEKGHRRDAARHALAYLVDHHLIDLKRLL